MGVLDFIAKPVKSVTPFDVIPQPKVAPLVTPQTPSPLSFLSAPISSVIKTPIVTTPVKTPVVSSVKDLLSKPISSVVPNFNAAPLLSTPPIETKTSTSPTDAGSFDLDKAKDFFFKQQDVTLQPAFAEPSEASKVKGTKSEELLYNAINRFPEFYTGLVTKLAATVLPGQKAELPFGLDAGRLSGAGGVEGEKTVQTFGQDYLDNWAIADGEAGLTGDQALNPKNPKSLLHGVISAANNIVVPALAVADAGEFAKAKTQEILTASGYKPTLKLKGSTVDGLTFEQAKQVVNDRLNDTLRGIARDNPAWGPKAQETANKAVWESLELLGRNSNDAKTTANAFSNKLEDVAIALNEPIDFKKTAGELKTALANPKTSQRGFVDFGASSDDLYKPKPKETVPPESPTDLSPLASEARKYKSAEEFVAAQEPIFHGTTETFSKFSSKKGFGGTAWFSNNKEAVANNLVEATKPSGSKWNVMERYVRPGVKLVDRNTAEGRKLDNSMMKDQLRSMGYGGIKHEADATRGSYIELLNPEKDALTKAELTDFYNQSVGKKTASVPVSAEIKPLAKDISDLQGQFLEDPEGYDTGLEDKVIANLEKNGYTYDSSGTQNDIKIGVKTQDINEAQKKISDLVTSVHPDITLKNNPDGTITLYHGTSPENADSILKGGADTDLYLSSSTKKEVGGVNGASYYGPSVLEVTVDPRKLAFSATGEFNAPKDAIVSIKKESTDSKLETARKALQSTEQKFGVKPVPPPKTASQVAFQYNRDVLEPKQNAGEAMVIGADDMKDHFGKDYGIDKHKMYSSAAYDVYNKALKTNSNPTVKFTAGGPGSGKTELLVPELSKDFNGIVYDSNFSNYEGAKKQIESARNAGKKVEVYGIVPDLERARIHTIQREAKTGRPVSDIGFGKGHANFVDTLSKLISDGTLKPEEVKLLDTRNVTFPEDVKTLAEDGEYVKDPLATLNHLGYSEPVTTKVATYARIQKDIEAGRNIDTRGTKSSVSSPRGDRSNSSRTSAPSRSSGQILPRKIRGVDAREYDVVPPPEKIKTENEQKLMELSIEKASLEDAIDSNPARKLAKYANKNGDLPEVLGGVHGGSGSKSKFGIKGDDIVTELGFKTPEEANKAYQEYKKLKSRLSDMKDNLRSLRKEIQDTRIQDKDAKALTRILEQSAKKSDPEYATSIVKKPETQEALQARKALARDNLQKFVGMTYKVQSPLEAETLDTQGKITQEAYNLTLQDHEKSAEGDPFKRIVIDANTPVKRKVSFLDYLRTPDRVLKKIGRGALPDALRQAYEGYLAELPLHTNLITEWSKRVSPEANKAIFRWLDGQTIKDYHAGKTFTDLAPNELAVAKEIKSYLGEWADRLGLPEDNKISHYITHVFGIGVNEKEFPDDVADLIKNRVPGSVYDPFLQERLGKKGYIEDTWKALDAYVKRAVRKANMDPALEQLERASHGLEDSQRAYLKRLGDRINMRPTEIDNLFDNFIKQIVGYKLGQRPTAFLARSARQMVYRSMLGINVGSAVKNLTQGVNTYAKLGERYTLTGYLKLLTQGGWKDIEKSGILGQDMVQDRGASAMHKGIQKIDKGLFVFFDLAEKINRGSAYLGARAKAIDKGATEEQADKYAKQIVRDTQFQFGSIDTPVGLNSDITKVVSQFMTFGVKQTEFAAEMAKNKEWAGMLRYILASLAIVYGVGKAFNIKGTDFIPGASFMKFGTPPTFAFPAAILSAVLDQPGYFGQKRDLKQKLLDIASAAPIPASLQAQKTYRGLKAYSDNKGGNVAQTKANLIKAAVLGSSNLKSDAPVFSGPSKNLGIRLVPRSGGSGIQLQKSSAASGIKLIPKKINLGIK